MTPTRTPSDMMATDKEDEIGQGGSDHGGRSSPALAEPEVATAQITDTNRSFSNEIISLNRKAGEEFDAYKDILQMLNHFKAQYETNLATITSIEAQEDAMYQIPAFLQNLTQVVTRSGLYTDEEADAIESDVTPGWSEEMTKLANVKNKLVEDNVDLGALMQTLRDQAAEAHQKHMRTQEELQQLHARNAQGGT